MTGFWYDVLMITPLSVAITIIANTYFVGKEVTPVWFITAVAVSIVLAGIKALKTKWRVIVTSAIVLCVCLFLLLLARAGKSEALTENRFVGIIILCVAISFVLNYVGTKIRYIKYACAFICIVILLVMLFTKTDISSVGVAMIVGYGLLVLCEIVQHGWNKAGYTDMPIHIVSISPFILAVMIAIIMIPAPKGTYKWTVFKDAWRFVKEECTRISQIFVTEDSFGGMYAGFSEDAVLSSEVGEGSKRAVLSVYPYTSKSEKMYLTGMTYDEFDGTSWKQTFNDTENDMLTDAVQTVASIDAFTDDAEDLYKDATVKISFLNTKTFHMFVPQKTVAIKEDGKKISYSALNGGMLFDKMYGVGTAYSLSYIDINTASSRFSEYMDADHNLSDEAVTKTIDKFQGYKELRKVSYEQILERRDKIYADYLPNVEISEKARIYLGEITQNATNDYEKLLAVQNALRSFEYTLTPGDDYNKSMSSEDFLDSILFDGKKGYCVHFATAMTLLARAEGIPARYVQGYYISTNGHKTTDVFGSNAHAWTEAYIDGVGWLVFDATPGYGVQEEDEWKNPTTGNNPYKDYMDKHDPAKEGALSEEIEQKEYKDTQEVRRQIAIVLIPILSGIVLIIIVVAIGKIISMRRYRRLGREQMAEMMCRENMRILRFVGFGLEKGETLFEIEERAKAILGEETTGFIAVFEKLLYSNESTAAGDMDIINRSFRAMMDALMKKRGRLYYLFASVIIKTYLFQ